MSGSFGHYAEDPLRDERRPRNSRTDVEVIVIVGGFGARRRSQLRESRIKDARTMDEVSDVGGTRQRPDSRLHGRWSTKLLGRRNGFESFRAAAAAAAARMDTTTADSVVWGPSPELGPQQG